MRPTLLRHQEGCLLFITVLDRGREILKENIHSNILLTGASQRCFCPLRLAFSLKANKSFIQRQSRERIKQPFRSRRPFTVVAAAGHRSNVEWLGCRRMEGLLRDRSALFGETGNAALIRPGAENQPERPASIYLPCAWNKSPQCVCARVCVCGVCT